MCACRYIQVPDSLKALQLLARRWREEFSIPLVGIGGSNGKTTTKEMTAAILSRRGPCLSTHGNLNNHIGVPLTLLRLEHSHRSAVIEMGANRIGDVAALVALARPTVGLITNAGAEHLEGFGDLDGVARGEGEMVAGLAPGAAAVINADDAYASYWRGVASGSRMVTFGVRRRCGLQGEGHACSRSREVASPPASRLSARSARAPSPCRPAVPTTSRTHSPPRPRPPPQARLWKTSRPASPISARWPGRLQLKAGLRDSWIIDDSYNANPSSVRAGLDVLRTLPGPAWLVLGDMAELGAHSADSHADTRSLCARVRASSGCSRSARRAPRAVETFGSGGEWFADADSLARRLQSEIAPGVTVLVKGSRVNRLERVVQALLGAAASSGPMMRAS